MNDTKTFTLNDTFKKTIAIEVEHVSNRAPVCPFIMGEPGIGKSSIVKAMADEHGWYFFELLCNQLGDRADLTGCRSVKTTNDKNEEIWKQVFFPHAVIQDAIACANEHPDNLVILFLDEINRQTSDITSAILSFTTARTIGTYTFPDNIRFIVAGNDKGNITALDSASISRFVKYRLKPSAKAYMDFETNLNPYIKQVLTKYPSYIFGKNINITTSTVQGDDGEQYENEYEAFDENAEGFEQITTPRTISGLNAFLNACTPEMIEDYISEIEKDPDTGETTTVLQTIIEGHVGQTLFANALCQAIADDISRGMLQKATATVKPTKPAIYKSIMRCTDRQTRDEMIKNMSAEDKSAVILYAMYEKGVDNSDLIQTIARLFDGQALSGDYSVQLGKLKSTDELDVDNYTALITSDTPLGNMTRMFLGD